MLAFHCDVADVTNKVLLFFSVTKLMMKIMLMSMMITKITMNVIVIIEIIIAVIIRKHSTHLLMIKKRVLEKS